MRYLIVFALALASCSKPEQARTTEFAKKDFAEAKLSSVCVDGGGLLGASHGGTPEASRQFFREWCALATDKHAPRRWSYVWIELQGHAGIYEGDCALRIGPGIVAAPVSPTILENFIEDPVLKQHLDERLKTVDMTKEYSLQTSVDGFQLDLVQQSVLVVDHQELSLDLRLDGCAQYPDTTPERRTEGRVIQVKQP